MGDGGFGRESIAIATAVIAWLLSILFISAATTKLRRRTNVVQIVAGYGAIPRFAVKPIGRLLPWTELSLGVGLAIPPFQRLSEFAAAAFLLCALGFVGVSVQRSQVPTTCGCFGVSDSRPDIKTVARLGALSALALLSALAMTGRVELGINLASFPVAVGTLLGIVVTRQVILSVRSSQGAIKPIGTSGV